jgi:pilus assembly protein Flp/PilA
MKSLLLRFIREESGQTSTEYILLVAVVALIVFKFRTIAEERLGGLVDGVFNGADVLVQQLNSGSR